MLNKISFTGREEMLTKGLKNPKQVTKTIEEAAGYFNQCAPHGGAETAVEKAAKASASRTIDSYVAAHQPINTPVSLAQDSAKSGEILEYFG